MAHTRIPPLFRTRSAPPRLAAPVPAAEAGALVAGPSHPSALPIGRVESSIEGRLARALRRPSVLDALARDSSLRRTRAVQRVGTLTVDRIDVDPVSGVAVDQPVLMARYGAALALLFTDHLDDIVAPAGAGSAHQRQAIRTRLPQDAAGYAGWADLHARDVEALATLIVAHLTRGPGGALVDVPRLHSGVIDALRNGLPSAGSNSGRPAGELSALTNNEIVAFNAVLGVATTRSSAKGNPSVVSQAVLDGAVAGLGAAAQGLRDEVAARNLALLRRMEREIDLIDSATLGAAAGLGMGVRSMHQNGAGWLPNGAVALPTTLTAQADLIDAAKRRQYTPQRNAYLAGLSSAERVPIRLSIERRAVRDVIGALPERTKIMLIWGSYAQNQGGLINYVEFNLGSRINRIMYDYVNGRFYITPHYNWYRGFNPFFQVTGLRDT